MGINHLLNGMILQVPPPAKKAWRKGLLSSSLSLPCKGGIGGGKHLRFPWALKGRTHSWKYAEHLCWGTGTESYDLSYIRSHQFQLTSEFAKNHSELVKRSPSFPKNTLEEKSPFWSLMRCIRGQGHIRKLPEQWKKGPKRLFVGDLLGMKYYPPGN